VLPISFEGRKPENPGECTRLMPLAVQGVYETLYYIQVASVYAVPASYLFAANGVHRPWHNVGSKDNKRYNEWCVCYQL